MSVERSLQNASQLAKTSGRQAAGEGGEEGVPNCSIEGASGHGPALNLVSPSFMEMASRIFSTSTVTSQHTGSCDIDQTMIMIKARTVNKKMDLGSMMAMPSLTKEADWTSGG